MMTFLANARMKKSATTSVEAQSTLSNIELLLSSNLQVGSLDPVLSLLTLRPPSRIIDSYRLPSFKVKRVEVERKNKTNVNHSPLLNGIASF